MYLVICKNKDGFSINEIFRNKGRANLYCKTLNKNKRAGNTYHLRKFDLASIDLEKLMENQE